MVPPFHTPKWSFLVGKPMVVGKPGILGNPHRTRWELRSCGPVEEITSPRLRWTSCPSCSMRVSWQMNWAMIGKLLNCFFWLFLPTWNGTKMMLLVILAAKLLQTVSVCLFGAWGDSTLLRYRSGKEDTKRNRRRPQQGSWLGVGKAHAAQWFYRLSLLAQGFLRPWPVFNRQYPLTCVWFYPSGN